MRSRYGRPLLIAPRADPHERSLAHAALIAVHLHQAELTGDAIRLGAADEEERVARGVRIGNLRIQEHARRLALPLLPGIDGRLGLAAGRLKEGPRNEC